MHSACDCVRPSSSGRGLALFPGRKNGPETRLGGDKLNLKTAGVVAKGKFVQPLLRLVYI